MIENEVTSVAKAINKRGSEIVEMSNPQPTLARVQELLTDAEKTADDVIQSLRSFGK
jgi:hypothetical protein